jgi:hypothetical protein
MIDYFLKLSNKGTVIVSPLIRGIKEFNDIYVEDGDPSKRIAAKEMVFICLYADYRSVYSLYPQQERTDVVREASNLPESWKPRQSTYKAIARYESFQDNPIIKSLKNMRKSIMLINNHIERLNNDIADLERIEVQDSQEEGEGKNIEGQITTKIGHIVKLQGDLEKATDMLASIEEKSKKINSDEDFKIKAGGRLGNREEPASIGSDVS